MPQHLSCHDHNLWHAVSLAPSLDHRFVYCRCGCGRFRQVARLDWEAEVRRRQARTRQDHPATTERRSQGSGHFYIILPATLTDIKKQVLPDCLDGICLVSYPWA
jgi:hypothetical protein